MIIGIIGGGQLGMMMVESIQDLPFSFVGLEPNKQCPLKEVIDTIYQFDYRDANGFLKFSEQCDIMTYEFENVDYDLMSQYQCKIPQKRKALEVSANRLIEKTFAASLNIPVPYFESYKNDYEYTQPVIIKTVTGGYDGKGQYVVETVDDFNKLNLNKDCQYIIEDKISFDYEISVICTRDQYGNVITFPIPINSHKNGILFKSLITNNQDTIAFNKAIKHTKKIVEKLDYVGTLAVEFFVMKDEVIFNEFAPRPHNSGHYTIEGCSVSQFRNHILAISNEKILEPKLIGPTVMYNILGQDMDKIETLKEFGEIHLYHKDDAKENRKMGHITVVCNSQEKLHEVSKKIEEVLS
jgi:5-(carboxyamino)imidazole ribonucleotide synthase